MYTWKNLNSGLDYTIFIELLTIFLDKIALRKKIDKNRCLFELGCFKKCRISALHFAM